MKKRFLCTIFSLASSIFPLFFSWFHIVPTSHTNYHRHSKFRLNSAWSDGMADAHRTQAEVLWVFARLHQQPNGRNKTQNENACKQNRILRTAAWARLSRRHGYRASSKPLTSRIIGRYTYQTGVEMHSIDDDPKYFTHVFPFAVCRYLTRGVSSCSSVPLAMQAHITCAPSSIIPLHGDIERIRRQQYMWPEADATTMHTHSEPK